MTNVTIPYKPRWWQRDFHNQNKRWNVLVCHRRAGKTSACVNELQWKKWWRGALNIKDWRFAYIAPTYKQAKNIVWDMLKYYSRPIPWMQYNEAELTAIYPNWSKIRLYWADNPDSLRWIWLDWVVFDEYAQQPANIFWEIIRPALSDRKWRAVWIWTPKWQNAFYELYKQWSTREDWYTQLLRASESNVIDPDELEDAKKTMTKEEYEQEYECSFIAAIKGAYYWADLATAREQWRVRMWIYEKILPVHTVRDLWIDDYMSIIFFQVHQWEVRIIDSYTEHWYWLDHYADVLQRKEYNYWTWRLPHDVEVRELTTGMSRLETFKKMHNHCQVVPKLTIEDGINAARLMFPKVFFEDEKTVALRNALANYRQEFDEKKWVFKEHPLHDWSSHFADAFRYLWVVYRNITTVVEEEMYTMDLDEMYWL